MFPLFKSSNQKHNKKQKQKNEKPKRAELGEWPNLPWQDKNGMNPKTRYILQCSVMQFRWLGKGKKADEEGKDLFI